MIYTYLLAAFLMTSLVLCWMIIIQPSKQQQSLLDPGDNALFARKKVRGPEKKLQIATGLVIAAWLLLGAGMMLV